MAANSIFISSGLPGDSINGSAFSRKESSVKVGSSSTLSSGVLLSSSVATNTLNLVVNFRVNFISVFFASAFFASTFFASAIFSISTTTAKTAYSSLNLFSATFLQKQPAFFFKNTATFSITKAASTFANSTSLNYTLTTKAKATISILIVSPFLMTRGALFSFFVTAHRHFFLSSLHSSFGLSTTAFLMTPTVTYSSEVLWADSSFFDRSIFFVPDSQTVIYDSSGSLSFG